MLVKISINDKYGYYDAGVRRIQAILEVLGLRQLTEWKRGAERSHVSQKFVEAWECDYESPYRPEDLKVILKAAELAAIPKDLKGKLPEDMIIGNVSYTKLCDVDVWTKAGFSILSTWDKVYSRILARKMRVAESVLWELGIQEWKTLLEAASQDKVEDIRRLEHSILTARTAE
jgi:transcriptional regulator with XRE-family HTH domain